MMNQEEKRNLFESWQKGTISESDLKRLEVEALEDDFLFEAMEGYATNQPNDSNRLLSLERKLKNRVRPAKTRRIWLVPAAAATIIAILAAVFLLRNETDVSTSQESELYSEVLDKAEDKNDDQTEQQVALFEETQDDEGFQQEEIITTPKMQENQQSLKKEREKDLAAEEVGGISADIAREEPESVIEEVIPKQELGTQSLPSTDKIEEDLAEEMLEMEADSYSMEDSPAESAAAASPMAKKSSPVPARANQMSNAAESQKSQPQMGFDAFKKYIKDNIKRTKAADENNIRGFVRLSFNVNNEGRPTKIEVISGLGYGLDKEAVRLLESTLWSQGQKNELTIDFE